MKDITHYFADTVRSCETSSAEDADHSSKVETCKHDSPKKRKRVKIKISRTNSRSRVCDIIETKNDMIDKTPSPFTNQRTNSKQLQMDGTPKLKLNGVVECEPEVLCSSHKNSVEENQSANCTTRRKRRNRKYELTESVDVDEKKVNVSNEDCTINVPCESDDSVSIMESQINDIDNDIDEREESNAFQVLMNRSKSSHNITSPQTLLQEVHENDQNTSDNKEKLKQYKEKLTTLADKKGYSKRKLAETEEGEKIEKRIENRVKIFKHNVKGIDNGDLNIGNNKQLSGNLLNYFSKAPLEMTPEDIKKMSTFVVKADVHVPDSSTTKSFSRMIHSKSRSNKTMNKKLNETLSKVNDIDIISSETLSPVNDMTDNQQVAPHRNKPRWALRIKMQPGKYEECYSDDPNEDDVFSPKSKAKFNDRYVRKTNKIVNEPCVEDTDLRTKNLDDKTKEKHLDNSVGSKLKSDKTKSRLGCQKNVTAKAVTSNVPKENNKKLSLDKQNSVPSIQNITEDKDRTIKLDVQRLSLPKGSPDDSDDVRVETVIEIDDTSEDCKIVNDVASKRKCTEKLAPLFTKRRKPDPTIIAARRLFLQSDINNCENRNTEKPVNPCVYSILPFPMISHVTQIKDTSSCTSVNYNVLVKRLHKYVPRIDVNDYKFVVDFGNSSMEHVRRISDPVGDNLEHTLSEMETQCSDARKMWASISSIIKDQTNAKSSPRRKIRNKKTLHRKETHESREEDNKVQDCVWTNKYKPLCTQDIVGNEEAAMKLRSWLVGWRSSLLKENHSSGEEFYSSDCSYASNNENNQVAVLIGPYGSGKSASVYAVAAELGYSVLEVNASSKRSGKKVLKDLEEATKSHRIKKDTSLLTFPTAAKKEVTEKIPQNSLILFEDVDLIFDEDEGFISATYQLASNTKRPIIMTCRDVCAHLIRMAPQQNRIYFQNVQGNRVLALLKLISLAETGHNVSHDYLCDLLQRGDLRKVILQLQFLLMSGAPHVSLDSVDAKKTLWQDSRDYVYKSAIKSRKKQSTKRATKSVTKSVDVDILCNIADKLDCLCVSTSLVELEDPALLMSREQTQLGISLVEDTSPYCNSHVVSSEIANWITNETVYKGSTACERRQKSNSFLLKKQLNTGVDLALSHVTPLQLDSEIVSTDYLPYVRAICRAEESRSTNNNKRGNRFFHYLHNLKLPVTSTRPNILTAACRMMQEKIEKEDSLNVNT